MGYSYKGMILFSNKKRWTLTTLQSQYFHCYIFLFKVFLCFPKCVLVSHFMLKRSLDNLMEVELFRYCSKNKLVAEKAIVSGLP